MVEQLANSDRELWATYHQLRASGLKLPGGKPWDPLRTVSEEALFEGYKEDIHFAALTLDDIGTRNYGECSVVLKEGLIAHRASVFEENNALFALHRNLRTSDYLDYPRGFRATWEDRGRLAATKAAGELEADTQSSDFAALLLQQGDTSSEDVFVEVRIYGPLTVRAVEKVTLTAPPNRRPKKVIIRALKAKLQSYGATLEEAP